MKKGENNFAFIDSQNLNLSIQGLGWKLDFLKFRKFLTDKYSVTKAYIFIGFVEGQANLYRSLQEKGYVLIFKPTLQLKDGTVKGNCDAELVLQAMIDFNLYDKAVIVSGDGDFLCLIRYLKEQGKLRQVLIPNRNRYSSLLNKVNDSGAKFFVFVSEFRNKLAYTKIKKGPQKDEP